VNGYNHRACCCLRFSKATEEALRPRGLPVAHLAEFFNVRAGDKRTAAADQDHGFDAVGPEQSDPALLKCFRDAGIQSVDRRIGDGDDGIPLSL